MTTFNEFEFNDRIRRENAMTGTNKNRMDGFINQTSLEVIRTEISFIIKEYRDDGYEDEEILDYLTETLGSTILNQLRK